MCINELRKALRDDTKSPRYIATVTKRGYRFIAPVAAAPVSSSEFHVAREQSERRRNQETGNEKLRKKLRLSDVMPTSHSFTVCLLKRAAGSGK